MCSHVRWSAARDAVFLQQTFHALVEVVRDERDGKTESPCRRCGWSFFSLSFSAVSLVGCPPRVNHCSGFWFSRQPWIPPDVAAWNTALLAAVRSAPLLSSQLWDGARRGAG